MTFPNWSVFLLEVQIREADVKTSDIMFTLSYLFCFCSLKLECEKLASEKTEMQRHYVMVGVGDTLFSFSCSMSKYVFLALQSTS